MSLCKVRYEIPSSGGVTSKVEQTGEEGLFAAWVLCSVCLTKSYTTAFLGTVNSEVQSLHAED